MNRKEYILPLITAFLSAATLSAAPLSDTTHSATPLTTRSSAPSASASSASLSELPTTSYATLQDGRLVIGNELIQRTFDWNGGNLRTISLTDKSTGKVFESAALRPDFVPMDKAPEATGGTFTTESVPQDNLHPAHLKAIVSYSLGSLQVRREYRIYDGVPAIACDTYLRAVSEHLGQPLRKMLPTARTSSLPRIRKPVQRHPCLTDSISAACTGAARLSNSLT